MDTFKFKSITANSYDFLTNTTKEPQKRNIKIAASNEFVAIHVTSSVRSYTIHSAKSSSTIIKFKNVTKKS